MKIQIKNTCVLKTVYLGLRKLHGVLTFFDALKKCKFKVRFVHRTQNMLIDICTDYLLLSST